MKKIFLALFAAATLLGAGCAKIDVAEGQLNVPEGEMAVKLGFTSPTGPGIRSYVSGEEKSISSIAMLCFDGEGKFITERDATVNATSATQGTLTGTVPANTCRIHFVANYTGLDLTSFGMGTLERTMMKSEALSSGINDEVRFWGYRTEASASAMKTWLSGGNTVMLLRDRAKVVLVKNLNSTADAISELKWTIGNGVNRGFVAPTTASGNNPYTNDYTTSTRLTEYTTAGRYATMEDTDATIWAGENEPQFLFENANTTSNPAKIIIKATYTDNTVKYHTVLLQSNENVPYPVVRNQTFTLTVKNLPKSVGSDNLADALSTTNYSNNPYAQVAREVDEVNNEGYTLKVESVTKMFHEDGNGVINFTYTAHGDGDISSLTPANFDVSWEAKSDDDETNDVVAEVTGGDLATPTVTFDAETGAGTITFPLATLSGELKHNTLQIVALNSGLSRYVDVYSITQFHYAVEPKLVDNHSTRTSGGEVREVYKLTFTLPDDLPPSQYPLHVKMYTSTLSPFSDNAANAASGSFNVVVDDTKDIAATEPAQSSVWNYRFKSWGQYYEYIIEQKPSESNTYTIYLNDIIANFSRPINTVGLYFHIDGFGDPIPLQAQVVVKETQTFQGANFSFSGNTGTATLGQATVTLGNSDQYFSSTLRIGRDQGDGTVTVAVSEGQVITGIEVTYYHRDQIWLVILFPAKDFVGGNVTANPGSYAKDGLTGTWSGDPAESVTLTMARDSENESPRITAITQIQSGPQGPLWISGF